MGEVAAHADGGRAVRFVTLRLSLLASAGGCALATAVVLAIGRLEFDWSGEKIATFIILGGVTYGIVSYFVHYRRELPGDSVSEVPAGRSTRVYGLAELTRDNWLAVLATVGLLAGFLWYALDIDREILIFLVGPLTGTCLGLVVAALAAWRWERRAGRRLLRATRGDSTLYTLP